MINFFWSLKRFIIKFQLNENVNEKKLIQSIQSLEEDNEFLLDFILGFTEAIEEDSNRHWFLEGIWIMYSLLKREKFLLNY